MRLIRIAIGVIGAGLATLLAYQQGLPMPMVATIGVTSLTALLWVSEALPIPITSLVPFALFPLTGVLTHKEAASAFGSHVIVLLMASFMLSRALERSGAHERLAIFMIGLVGSSGRRLVFGFMLAAALLSMWISNVATTLMLMTMALAILARSDDRKLAVPLLLGIAYAASFGGTATLIGTPPNLIFADAFESETGTEFGFLRFMQIGLPSVIVGIPIMALWLTRGLGGVQVPQMPNAGPWRVPEIRTMIVFAVAISLWITRLEPFGGWSGWFGLSGAGDSTVAVFAVLLMFIIPSGDQARPNTALMDWESAVDIPWGMLLLFAGGICIAIAFRSSGLDDVIGDQLAGLAVLHPFVMILGLTLSVTFLTEITSNTATANLLMPLLAAVATSADIPHVLIMFPAVVAASCAFMLPMATAPNAIVYGTGRVTMADMVREGFLLNIVMAVVVATVCYVLLA